VKKLLANNFSHQERTDLLSSAFLTSLGLLALLQLFGEKLFSTTDGTYVLGFLFFSLWSIQFTLVVLAIVTGGLLLYLNRDKIDDMEDEQAKELREEEKRKAEFGDKFPVIAKIPVLNWIVKWMYKEGWKWSLGLVLIFMLFLAIRFWMPLYFTWSYVDEYYHIASAMSLVESGSFAPVRESILNNGYTRWAYISYLVSFLIALFWNSIFIAKLVPASLGVVNFMFLYLILKNFIKDKVLVLLSLVVFTFSYYTVFNHFYIRMYVFYETALIISIFLWFLLIKFINNYKFTYSILVLIFIWILNYISYFLSNDNGKYIILLVNLIFFSLSFILYIKGNGVHLIWVNELKKYSKLFIYKFLFLFLFSIIIFFTTGLNNKWKFLFDSNLKNYAREWSRFFNLFFETNLLFSTLFIVSIIALIFSRKNIYHFLLGLVALVLFLVHIISDPEMQLTRTILYYLPIFFVVSTYFVLFFIKINKSKFVKILTIIIIIASVFNAYPKNFLNDPSIHWEIWYVDYKKSFDYIAEHYPDHTKIAAYQNTYLSYFYTSDIKYKLNLWKDYQGYFDSSNNQFYFTDIFVITTEDEFIDILKKEDACLIIRELNRWKLLNPDNSNVERLIDEYLKNTKKFTRMTIACS
jgi:hypothetical protein